MSSTSELESETLTLQSDGRASVKCSLVAALEHYGVKKRTKYSEQLHRPCRDLAKINLKPTQLGAVLPIVES